MSTWKLDQSHGQLVIRTGVEGPMAKMGHRLTIAMNAWRATVDWTGSEPVGVELTVDVDSLDVLSAEGGLTPLLGPEKALVRANAVKVFDGKRFPQIVYTARDIDRNASGYLLHGTVQLRGRTRDQQIDLRVDDLGNAWRMSCEAKLSHRDFALKPYSMMMGSMKVADAVHMSFTAQRGKN